MADEIKIESKRPLFLKEDYEQLLTELLVLKTAMAQVTNFLIVKEMVASPIYRGMEPLLGFVEPLNKAILLCTFWLANLDELQLREPDEQVLAALVFYLSYTKIRAMDELKQHEALTRANLLKRLEQLKQERGKRKHEEEAESDSKKPKLDVDVD